MAAPLASAKTVSDTRANTVSEMRAMFEQNTQNNDWPAQLSRHPQVPLQQRGGSSNAQQAQPILLGKLKNSSKTENQPQAKQARQAGTPTDEPYFGRIYRSQDGCQSCWKAENENPAQKRERARKQAEQQKKDQLEEAQEKTQENNEELRLSVVQAHKGIEKILSNLTTLKPCQRQNMINRHSVLIHLLQNPSNEKYISLDKVATAEDRLCKVTAQDLFGLLTEVYSIWQKCPSYDMEYLVTWTGVNLRNLEQLCVETSTHQRANGICKTWTLPGADELLKFLKDARTMQRKVQHEIQNHRKIDTGLRSQYEEVSGKMKFLVEKWAKDEDSVMFLLHVNKIGLWPPIPVKDPGFLNFNMEEYNDGNSDVKAGKEYPYLPTGGLRKANPFIDKKALKLEVEWKVHCVSSSDRDEKVDGIKGFLGTNHAAYMPQRIFLARRQKMGRFRFGRGATKLRGSALRLRI